MQAMEPIDRFWIIARLTKTRGEKTRLAKALGIGPDMVTKILSGDRKLQQDEIPKVVSFFGGPDAVTLTGEDRDFWGSIQSLPPSRQKTVRLLVEQLKEGQADDKPEGLPPVSEG